MDVAFRALRDRISRVERHEHTPVALIRATSPSLYTLPSVPAGAYLSLGAPGPGRYLILAAAACAADAADIGYALALRLSVRGVPDTQEPVVTLQQAHTVLSYQWYVTLTTPRPVGLQDFGLQAYKTGGGGASVLTANSYLMLLRAAPVAGT